MNKVERTTANRKSHMETLTYSQIIKKRMIVLNNRNYTFITLKEQSIGLNIGSSVKNNSIPVVDKNQSIKENRLMPLLKRIYFFFIDTIQSILIAASIFLVIYMFLFRPFQVNGTSMFPTFKDGQFILTNLITLRISGPVRGDVIVFNAPIDQEKDFIKRVIGLPGDTIYLQNGNVYVNGKKYDESAYLHGIQTGGGDFLHEGQTITVPDNNYFVMGDNRPASSDSREWGFVPVSKLIGKSMLVYWPLNALEVVTNPVKDTTK